MRFPSFSLIQATCAAGRFDGSLRTFGRTDTLERHLAGELARLDHLLRTLIS
jgi:hypothetical protein